MANLYLGNGKGYSHFPGNGHARNLEEKRNADYGLEPTYGSRRLADIYSSGVTPLWIASEASATPHRRLTLRRPPAVSHVLEALVHELNRHRAFANRRGDAF
jgi:hypothetical protein